MEPFHRTGRGTSSGANSAVEADSSRLAVQSYSACASSTADCRLMDYNMGSVALDCECMDGRYNVGYTSTGAGAAAVDSDDVMRKLVAKAVRV